MTPFFADDWLTVYAGDCRDVLPTLAADSVDCIVTSPPYWGLRDYGSEGQLGLEATPELYVANLVAVFRELRRVLKPSGTCWLNLGDSYASEVKGSGGDGTRSGLRKDGRPEESRITSAKKSISNQTFGGRRIQTGLKPKDLVGIPWRVAFALQADGWYLRSDIIWAKPNPMPESVTDRPTKAHEYLFLLTKSARYFYDADAVREPLSPTASYGGTYRGDGKDSVGVIPGRQTEPIQAVHRNGKTIQPNPAGRNLRSVWTIATRPYPGAHFAVFPPELPERCIKAGSSERGVCPECGAPWERVVERTTAPWTDKSSLATGWQPTCGCQTGRLTRVLEGEFTNHPWAWSGAAPAVVLDPFAGSGTVGLVANRLSRRAILIDLNPEYVTQQMRRNAQTPLGLPA